MNMKAPVVLLSLLFFGVSVAADGGAGKKVLMIFSSGALMGDATARNNLWEYGNSAPPLVDLLLCSLEFV